MNKKSPEPTDNRAPENPRFGDSHPDARPAANDSEAANAPMDASRNRPPAGPHAKPELTNEESTPGSGLLPDPERPSDTPDSTSG